jgi:hypothetical protein
MSWAGPKCRHPSQFMYCCDSWLPWKFCLSGCCLDTDLHNLYLGSDLIICGRFPWKAPTSTNRGDWCLGGEAYNKMDMAPKASSLGSWYIWRRCCWSYGSSRFEGLHLRCCIHRYLEWRGVLLVNSSTCMGSPLCMNPLVVPMPHADHVGVTNLWG